MKIYVDKLPTEPFDCRFSLRPLIAEIYQKDLLLKCSFRVNKTLSEFDSYGYTPDHQTCFLHENKECPFLKTLLVNEKGNMLNV